MAMAGASSVTGQFQAEFNNRKIKTMSHRILGLLAETSIHPGAGRSVGVVDLPVAREAATDYPVLVGSSLKGALKQWANEHNSLEKDHLFGKQEGAGALLISDARLLLLPVRSLDTAYKWVTCLHLLERFQRDAKRAGLSVDFELPDPQEGEAIATKEGDLFLEERQFKCTPKPDSTIIKALESIIPHATTRSRLGTQLVILHDDDFAWFARYGLAVNARNVLDEKTKSSKNLWYEETLPPDSLFYAVLSDRNPNGTSAVTTLDKPLNTKPYLQAGGNETVGMGWFAVSVLGTDRKETQS